MKTTTITTGRAIILIAHVHALFVSLASALAPFGFQDRLTLNLKEGETDEPAYGLFPNVKDTGLTATAELMNGRMAMLGLICLVRPRPILEGRARELGRDSRCPVRRWPRPWRRARASWRWWTRGWAACCSRRKRVPTSRARRRTGRCHRIHGPTDRPAGRAARVKGLSFTPPADLKDAAPHAAGCRPAAADNTFKWLNLT